MQYKPAIFSLSLLGICLFSLATTDVAVAISPPSGVRLTLPFVANQGQYAEDVAFSAPAFGGTIFVTTKGKLVYRLPHDSNPQMRQALILSEELLGGKPATVQGREPSPMKVHYFLGNEPTQWRHDTPTYRQVSLGEVYDGVTVRLKAYDRTVEKLFVVQPSARAEQIRLRVTGGKALHVNTQGELEVETALGNVRFSKPVAYQERDRQKTFIPVAYTAEGDSYGFQVGQYDRTRELVIDPVLAATFLGGSADDEIRALGLDNAGHVYAAGQTSSPDFPGIGPSAPDQTLVGATEAFVAKFDATLSTILAVTFLGGSNVDEATALAVDGAGDVYVAGTTKSSLFPGVSPTSADPIHVGSTEEGFVVKLNADLDAILAATFLGGAFTDAAHALALNAAGEVYVAGATQSLDFPGISPDSADSTRGGYADAFVAKLDPDLQTVLGATFWGGLAGDSAAALAVDNTGVYVGGKTETVLVNVPSGSFYGFVVKFNPGLQTIKKDISLFGGLSVPRFGLDDEVSALALDGTGHIYAGGKTTRADFPGVNSDSADSVFNSSDCSGVPCPEGFVMAMDTDLQFVLKATYLGGLSYDFVSALTVDSAGDIYVAGSSSPDSLDPGKIGGTLSGQYVARLDADLHQIRAARTFTGEIPRVVVSDSVGHVYVAGDTESAEGLKSAPGLADPTVEGREGFIAHLRLDSHPVDLTLPVGGQVVVELLSADTTAPNVLSLLSPTAAVAKSGCEQGLISGIVGTPILSAATSDRGCRVFLDADPVTAGVQKFSAGTTLRFVVLEDLDFVGLTPLHTQAFPGQIFRLAWRRPGRNPNISTLIVVVRIVQPSSVCLDCSSLDDDGDGLWDDWERFGLDINGDGVVDLDLRALGANSTVPDIFVEIDYMDCAVPGGDCPLGDTHTHRPKEDALNAVMDAFQHGGLSRGPFRLHIDVDQTIPHQELTPFSSGKPGDFDALKAQYFGADNPRRFVYHYGLFAHSQQKGSLLSGHADLPGNDFMVSLGGWNTDTTNPDLDGDGLDDEHVGTVQQQAGTLMHELGHNFDLRHGGEDGKNRKPNYPSIMNHVFQVTGIATPESGGGGGPLTGAVTYSDGRNPPLDEQALDEHNLVCPGCGATPFLTKYLCPQNACPLPPEEATVKLQPIESETPVDWNCDGDVADSGVSNDINGDCDLSQLVDTDDWLTLQLPFQTSQTFIDGVHSAGAESELDALQLTTVTTSQQDSFIQRSAGAVNVGADPLLAVMAGAHALVGFDLSFLESNVTRAKLVLTIAAPTRDWRAKGGNVEAHRILTPFVEGNGVKGSERGSGPGVTWQCATDAEIGNDRADCDALWQGGTTALGPTTDQTLHFSRLPSGKEVEWDVTADVQEAFAEGKAQVSWLLKKKDREPGRVAYYSREGSLAAVGNASVAPRLFLWFE
ncbi:MAG: SBBP repeat-containing protein [Deltaproteobacteria bacterium]|nr:SBBP repeat-containing protein [Deltaproteobacteria bacterium]